MNGAGAAAAVVALSGLSAYLLRHQDPVLPWAAGAMGVFSLLVLLEWHVRPRGRFSLISGGPVVVGAASFLLAAFGWTLRDTPVGIVLMLTSVAAFLVLTRWLARATSPALAVLCLPLLVLYALICAIGGVLGFTLTALHTPARQARP